MHMFNKSTKEYGVRAVHLAVGFELVVSVVKRNVQCTLHCLPRTRSKRVDHGRRDQLRGDRNCCGSGESPTLCVAGEVVADSDIKPLVPPIRLIVRTRLSVLE